MAKDMGIDLTSAVTMFITKMVKNHELPFTPTIPPVEKLVALKKAEHPKTREKFSTPDEMWYSLDV